MGKEILWKFHKKMFTIYEHCQKLGYIPNKMKIIANKMTLNPKQYDDKVES